MNKVSYRIPRSTGLLMRKRLSLKIRADKGAQGNAIVQNPAQLFTPRGISVTPPSFTEFPTQ